MNARAIICGLGVGFILASGTVALADAGWSWYTDAEGSASGSLGALTPLEVSDAKGGDGLLPGETMLLKVNIRSDNRVPLDIVSVEIEDLKSGDDECNASLENSRLRFDRTPNIVVQPGDNDGVVLGSVKLPNLLAQSCQSEDVSAKVNLRAAYGSNP